MLNIEKYRDEVENDACEIYRHELMLCTKAEAVGGAIWNVMQSKNVNTDDVRSILDWLCSEYKEPILDDGDKAYLSTIIAPFRHRIESITKILNPYADMYFICITVKKYRNSMSNDEILLPNFPAKWDMYKNMQDGKAYTLDELGL